MIEMRPHTGDDADWLATVVACGGHALHLPAVHRVDHAPECITRWVFVREAETLGCALAIETRTRPGRWSLSRVKDLILPTAPALVSAAHGPEVRRALFDRARAAGARHLLVHPGGSDWLVGDADLAAFRTGSIVEFVLDLGAGEEAVFAGFHKTHRKNVRRAQRAGLHVVEDSSVGGLLRLRTMQLASSDRASERAEGFDVREEEFFRRLHAEVYAPGLGTLLFAELEGEAVAALASLALGGRVQTVRSGSLPAGYESRAMYLLYDELVRRSIAAGARELNAGGVPSSAAGGDHAQSGLYEFKAGFGGRAVERHALRVLLSEVQG